MTKIPIVLSSLIRSNKHGASLKKIFFCFFADMIFGKKLTSLQTLCEKTRKDSWKLNDWRSLIVLRGNNLARNSIKRLKDNIVKQEHKSHFVNDEKIQKNGLYQIFQNKNLTNTMADATRQLQGTKGLGPKGQSQLARWKLF